MDMRLCRSPIALSVVAVVSVLAGACASAPQKRAAPTNTEPAPQHSHVSSESSTTLQEVSEPEVVVRANFESSVLALEPGGKLLLMARFHVHEGYRISWKNPGDVGKATVARFSVPEGFELSEVMYPRPRRFVLNGDLVSYGYRGETALFAQVSVPEGLDEQTAYRFELEAEWMACKKQCAGESTSAFFELLVDSTAPRAALEPALGQLFDSVPRPVSALGRAQHRWQARGAEAELSLSAAEVEWLDYYPAERELPRLLGVAGSKHELLLRFAAPEQPPEMIRGIAIARIDGTETTFDIEVPWGK